MPTSILARRASNSHFRRGSGSFRCESCDRITRQTGAQSNDSRLCPDCFELAGNENRLSDGCLHEIDKRGVLANFQNCVKHGGNEAALRASFARLIEWAESPAS